MDHIGFPAQLARDLRDSLREKYETFRVVWITRAVFHVDTFTIVIFWLIDKKYRQVPACNNFSHMAHHDTSAHGDAKGESGRLNFWVLA